MFDFLLKDDDSFDREQPVLASSPKILVAASPPILCVALPAGDLLLYVPVHTGT